MTSQQFSSESDEITCASFPPSVGNSVAFEILNPAGKAGAVESKSSMFCSSLTFDVFFESFLELFVVWRSFVDVKTNLGFVNSSSDSTFSALTSSVFAGGAGIDIDPWRDHCNGAGPARFAASSCGSASSLLVLVCSGFFFIVRALESSSELSFSDSESLDPESENIDLNTSTGWPRHPVLSKTLWQGLFPV